MAFTITTQPFGPLALTESLTLYRITNLNTGEYADVLPGYGGVLRGLALRKGVDLVELIEAPQLPDADAHHSAFLIPFPSRLPHGTYTFDGHTYTLPLNAPPHAMHGFVHPKPFEVVSQEITDNQATIVLRHRYEGDLEGFPFPFEVWVSYTLEQAQPASVLYVRYRIVNIGLRACPMAFGWHPYFKINQLPIDEMTLTVPDSEQVILDADVQPTDQTIVQTSTPMPIRGTEFNNVYRLKKTPTGLAETVLENPNRSVGRRDAGRRDAGGSPNVKLILTQQTDSEPFLVCYTPPNRSSIAIEPWSANVNAFTNADGLVRLEAGAAITGEISVRLM